MKSDNKQMEIKTTNQKHIVKDNEDKEYAEIVVIKPVGYPFDFNLISCSLITIVFSIVFVLRR